MAHPSTSQPPKNKKKHTCARRNRYFQRDETVAVERHVFDRWMVGGFERTKVVGGIFYTGGIFYITLFSKCFQFAARRGLKLVTNIFARKPNATWGLRCHCRYDIRKKFQKPPKYGTCASWSPQRATAFRFERSEPARMNKSV